MKRFRTHMARITLVALALLVGGIMANGNTANALILSRDLQAQLNDTAWYKRCDSSNANTTNDVDNSNDTTGAKYKKLGKVPEAGLDTAATTYGGGYNGQQKTWQPSNALQGGGNDDNGMGADGKPLPGRTAWAELGVNGGIGNGLGNLPMGTKLEIRYGGQSIVALKADVGSDLAEPIDGKDPTVDLWWETARLLDFKNGTAPIKIFVLADQNTPVTPLDGKSGTVADEDKPVQTCACGAAVNQGSGSLKGDSNVEKSYNFLVDHGVKPIHAAAIVGNLMWESGGGTTVNPKAVNPTSGAYGIAQWLYGRKISLNRYVAVYNKEQKAKDPDNWKNVEVSDLGLQLNFLWKEITGSHKAAYNALKKETNVSSATITWEKKFEISGDEASYPKRIKGAKAVLQKYGNGAAEDDNDPNSPDPEGQCPGAVVNCNSNSLNDTTISQKRKNIVCVAQQELKLWEAELKKNPNFSQKGYHKYSQGVTEDWCGDFASWVYKEAGVPLGKPRWRYALVSDYDNLAKKGQFEWHPAGSGYKPKPGDLATHRGFAHVNIYIETKGGVQQYIGGNQGHGPYPGGSIVSISTGQDVDGYLSPVD